MPIKAPTVVNADWVGLSTTHLLDTGPREAPIEPVQTCDDRGPTGLMTAEQAAGVPLWDPRRDEPNRLFEHVPLGWYQPRPLVYYGRRPAAPELQEQGATTAYGVDLEEGSRFSGPSSWSRVTSTPEGYHPGIQFPDARLVGVDQRMAELRAASKRYKRDSYSWDDYRRQHREGLATYYGRDLQGGKAPTTETRSNALTVCWVAGPRSAPVAG